LTIVAGPQREGQASRGLMLELVQSRNLSLQAKTPGPALP
jgi:hypothetical protein